MTVLAVSTFAWVFILIPLKGCRASDLEERGLAGQSVFTATLWNARMTASLRWRSAGAPR
jgi:hypothetical protein